MKRIRLNILLMLLSNSLYGQYVLNELLRSQNNYNIKSVQATRLQYYRITIDNSDTILLETILIDSQGKVVKKYSSEMCEYFYYDRDKLVKSQIVFSNGSIMEDEYNYDPSGRLRFITYLENNTVYKKSQFLWQGDKLIKRIDSLSDSELIKTLFSYKNKNIVKETIITERDTNLYHYTYKKRKLVAIMLNGKLLYKLNIDDNFNLVELRRFGHSHKELIHYLKNCYSKEGVFQEQLVRRLDIHNLHEGEFLEQKFIYIKN